MQVVIRGDDDDDEDQRGVANVVEAARQPSGLRGQKNLGTRVVMKVFNDCQYVQ